MTNTTHKPTTVSATQRGDSVIPRDILFAILFSILFNPGMLNAMPSATWQDLAVALCNGLSDLTHHPNQP